jgi:hypothetical protein
VSKKGNRVYSPDRGHGFSQLPLLEVHWVSGAWFPTIWEMVLNGELKAVSSIESVAGSELKSNSNLGIDN